MKNLKLRLFLAAFIIAASFSIAAIQPVDKTFTTYRYISDSDDFAEMQEVGNWEAGTLSCGPTGTVPCQLIYNGGDFATHLANYEDKEALLEDAAGQRTP